MSFQTVSVNQNLWQSEKWKNFQQKLNKKVFWIKTDWCIWVAILQQLRSATFLEIPRWPLWIPNKTFWNEVEKISKEQSCVFTRISPVDVVPDLPFLSFKSPDQIHPENTLIINLELSEDEILKQMKPKWRYNIRVAQRNKIKIIETKNINDFYKILEETTLRDWFSSHDEKFYKIMMESFWDDAKLYLAEYYDEKKDIKTYIAWWIFIYNNKTCTYYYWASSNNYRNLMAPYLLQWKALSDAKNNWYEKYDFLWIAPKNIKKHKLIWVTQFKTKFWGKRISHPSAKDIVHKPLLYILYRIYKIIRKIW